MNTARRSVERTAVVLLVVAIFVVAAGVATLATDKWAAIAAVIIGLGSFIGGLALTPGGMSQWLRPRSVGIGELRAILIDSQERERVKWRQDIPTDARLIPFRFQESESATRTAYHTIGEFLSTSGGALMLSGPAGSGKSTALRMVHAELLQSALGDVNEPVPILIPMSLFGHPHSLVSDLILSHIVHSTGLSREDATQLLPIISPLLDGLDEVGEAQRIAAADAIGDYILAHPGTSLIVSCRSDQIGSASGLLSLGLAIKEIASIDLEYLRQQMLVRDGRWEKIALLMSSSEEFWLIPIEGVVVGV